MSRKRETRSWEETKENYGSTLEEIKAEFQSQGLKSLGSNAIYESKVKIGKKHNFKCSIGACDFLIRVEERVHSISTYLIETSGKLFTTIG